MVDSIKSPLEIDENTARKFTVVHILENCINKIKYGMLSAVLTAKTVLLIMKKETENSSIMHIERKPMEKTSPSTKTKPQS